MITLENGYKLNDGHLYKYFKTPMDYLQKNVAAFRFRQGREQKMEVMPFSSIIDSKNICLKNIGNTYRMQRDRIINIVEDTNNTLQKLYIGYDSKSKEEKEEIKIQVADIKQECTEYINDLCINETTMYLLLMALDNKDYRHIKRRIFETLFGTPNQTFFKMIIDNSGDIGKITENSYGDIELYNFKFSKEYVNK